MKRKQFLKAVTSVAFLPGCLSSSSDNIGVQNKEMSILDRDCIETVHEDADITFDKPKETISISGTVSLSSKEEKIATSIFTTKGGDGASGKDSVIVKISSEGGTQTNSPSSDCVPILKYNLQIEFNRMPIDVLVDYQTRKNGDSGFIAHANYNDSESGN